MHDGQRDARERAGSENRTPCCCRKYIHALASWPCCGHAGKRAVLEHWAARAMQETWLKESAVHAGKTPAMPGRASEKQAMQARAGAWLALPRGK